MTSVCVCVRERERQTDINGRREEAVGGSLFVQPLQRDLNLPAPPFFFYIYILPQAPSYQSVCVFRLGRNYKSSIPNLTTGFRTAGPVLLLKKKELVTNTCMRRGSVRAPSLR